MYCTVLHCNLLHFTTLQSLHFPTLQSLHCTLVNCTLNCNIWKVFYCLKLHCTELDCTARHCTALHCYISCFWVADMLLIVWLGSHGLMGICLGLVSRNILSSYKKVQPVWLIAVSLVEKNLPIWIKNFDPPPTWLKKSVAHSFYNCIDGWCHHSVVLVVRRHVVSPNSIKIQFF